MSVRSYTKIWLHIIWPTFNHDKILTDENLRLEISKFIKEYAFEKNINMEINYVLPYHVHGLIDLPTNMNIEDTMQLFKGSSSNWINKQVNFNFRWAKGYGAFSVSESVLDKVVKYILTQKQHHKTKLFQEEYSDFLAKYNIGVGNG